MADPFVGEIRDFGFQFPPLGWLPCDGRLLEIKSNQALFNLLGKKFGGDGIKNFGIPDLRGRVPIGKSSEHKIGKAGGELQTTLTLDNLPSHTHNLAASSARADTTAPNGGALANSRANSYETIPQQLNEKLLENCVAPAGAGEPVMNQQPYLVTNFCIAIVGVYPSRS